MKHKILIIEDNHDVRENIREILALSGYDTLSATNGKEGIQMAVEKKPDLILCDIMMPELDGYGVLRILSKNQITSGIPFIFLTAKSEMTDMRRGMTLGADDYITKPFDDVELLDTIEIRLQKKKNISPTEHSDNPDILHVFSGKNLLELLPEELLQHESRIIRRKELVYGEGQPCRNIFILKSGRAVAVKSDDYSKEVITRIYQSPLVIGVTSALSGSRYTETVRAFEDIEVLPVRSEDFMHHIRQDISLSYFLLQQMASVLITADEKILLQAFGTVRMKLVSVLIDLYHFYEVEGKAIIPIPREDLASLAGTAKETIIRSLSELKEEGIVSIQGTDIIIDSFQKLMDLK